MFEYDNETILRILKIENFNIDNLNLKEIKHIPMHQYKVSSPDKPLLLIENLQVCISLYAYSENFGFAAHLNPVVIRNNEFQLDKNKNIAYCHRIDDLFNSILTTNPKSTVHIGISLGFCPNQKSYELVKLLDKSIDNLINKLYIIGIKANKLKLIQQHIFILDTTNQCLKIPSNKPNEITTKRILKKELI